MIFTAQQARDNHRDDVSHILEVIYEKIKIASRDETDLSIVFGDTGIEYVHPRDETEITNRLEAVGYSVRWDVNHNNNPRLYINWRF